jgi:hypothetical protein
MSLVFTLCYKFDFYIVVGDIWYFITLVSNMDEQSVDSKPSFTKRIESTNVQQVVQKGRKLH